MVRASFALLLLALAGLLCCGARRVHHRVKKPKPAPVAKPAPAAPQTSPAPLKPLLIPLQPNLRFTIRPTLLGLVPPEDPTGYGECFVRVLQTAPMLIAHYEVKEQHEQPVPGSHIRTTQVTTIRRGEIEAKREAPALDPPPLWPSGGKGWSTSGGLLWLNPGALEQLRATGVTPLDLSTPPEGADAQLTAGLSKLMQQRRELYRLPAGEGTKLVVQDWSDPYPAYVNGMRVMLPALRCTDSLRLAQYWILDDPGNPLVLELSYQPPPLAVSEPPKPAEKPKPSATSSTTRNSSAQGSSAASSSVIEPSAKPDADPAAALIDQGAGYAVVTIDF